jgi:hypothetical protein
MRLRGGVPFLDSASHPTVISREISIAHKPVFPEGLEAYYDKLLVGNHTVILA